MHVSNAVASYVDDSENTPTVMTSGFYWGKTKRSKQEILQIRFVCVKFKVGAEGYCERYFRHKNDTATLSQTFDDANNFVPRNSEGESKSNRYTYIQSEYVVNITKMKLLE